MMPAWISHLLSKLFPPKLPGRLSVRDEQGFDEQGCAGNVQPKQYRNGIERHFAENTRAIHRSTWAQYHIQLIHAQKEIAVFERDLVTQGYVNTMHDCWEQKELTAD
jgi:hypothetical protein